MNRSLLGLSLINSLPVAVPESVAKCFEACDVPRQFEDSENSEDSEDLSSLGQGRDGVLGGEAAQELGDKERKNSKKVNDIQKREQKLNLKLGKFYLDKTNTHKICSMVISCSAFLFS